MRVGTAFLIAWLAPAVCAAQDLTPRAYVLVPVESNAVVVTYAFADGELLFDPTVPIEDAVGTIQTPVFTYFYTFDFFGRASNISGSIPFAIGDFNARVLGADRSAHRQGLADIPVRFSVNLIGGPALDAATFVKTKPSRTTLGASVKVIAPTGQYNPAFAINIGTNRWSFKPELGFTRHAGPFTLDMYAGVWFFTSNDNYFASVAGAPPNSRTQEPIGAFEFHVSYDVRPRLWISADINYWRGGKASINGVRNNSTLQANSRFGVTGSVPLTRHQAVKVSYSDGVVVRIGGNYKILSMGWQYSWLGAPFKMN
jgi:Putative MetA-pathway of phenol degradation